jgi:sigma-B regulation protein RsbU (phosphoserine phosphatase)
MGLPPTGKPFRISGVFLYRLSSGLIAHERRVYDLSGILLQLAGELGAALDSARRYRETLERVRLEHDLRIAAQVQRALLPEPAYSTDRFELVATSLPCRAIGGDFFDYFELSRGAFGFALGDVAGKGPPAALLAAMLQGIFAAHAHLGGSTAETLARANESLVRREVESRFATMLYAVLSYDGHLTYCNAGHNPPLLIGRRGLRRLEKGGLVIGMFKGASFEEETVQLQCGDTVVMFSDGVSEALNLDDEEFGDDRLLECARENWELSPSDLLKCLLDTVHQFTAGAAQSDDLTVLILRYLGRAA